MQATANLFGNGKLLPGLTDEQILTEVQSMLATMSTPTKTT